MNEKDGKELRISRENVELKFDSRFIRVVDLQYTSGKHYLDATRRKPEDLVAVKSDEDFQTMLPDAVSCIVILKLPGEEPRLLLSHEFRYPAGRYLLSVPAGLIDERDRTEPDPLLATAIREIREETGLKITDRDSVSVVNPLLFSTPGMTDESNALVCAVVHLPDLSALSQEGAEGSEKFDGFCLMTKAQARETLKKGRDEAGNFYSIYTWAALVFFLADMWKEEL